MGKFRYGWVHERVKSWKDFGSLREGERPFLKIVRAMRLGGRLLDIGCGYGRASLRFADAGFEVTGIDNNRDAVRKFNRFARERNLPARAFYRNVSRYNLGTQEWNAIVCEYVFQALQREQAEDLLQRIQGTTKKGGINFVGVFTNVGEAFADRRLLATRGIFPKGYLHSAYSNRRWEVLYNVEQYGDTMKTAPDGRKLGQVYSEIIAVRR